jgi:hypothetical protein
MTQEFYTVEDVPLFHTDDEHDIDRQKLARLVQVNNDRYSRGELSCIVVGHTNKTNQEKPCIGLVDHLDLRERNGIPTVYGRFQMYAENKEDLKRYPRRSIEIGLKSLEMPTVALLGGTAPAHELGLVMNEKGRTSDQLLIFSKEKMTVESLHTYESKGETMVSDELKLQILEVLGETDVFAFVQQLMDEKTKEANAEEAEETGESKAEEFSEEKSDEKPEGDSEDKPEAKEDKSEDKAEKKPEAKEDEDKEKKEFAKYSMIEKENRTLKAQLMYFERQNKLTQLLHEGYAIDVQEELTDSADMTEPQFGKHLDRIRRFSKRAPVGFNFDTSRIDIPKDTYSTLEIAKVQEIARAKKLDFKTALNEYSKTK